jgi:uncharacterized protein YfaS (alpha-2-macroglobulin family)
VRALYSLPPAIAIVALVSCGQPGPAKLEAVAPLARPALPSWIASISPTKSAQNLAQIRVIFNKPIVPLEAVSSAQTGDVLSHFAITPQLAGHFTVLTPRMVGFVAERALPIGTRVRVTLSAGLKDTAGDTLAQDLAWTFATDPLAVSDMPQIKPPDSEETASPVELDPALEVTTNAAVDVTSLQQHATLNGGGEQVGVTVKLDATPTPYPGSNAQELFDPSLNTWTYTVHPTHALQHATTYALRIAPGVEPAYGNVPSAQRFDGGIRTYGALTILPTPSASPDSSGRFAAGDPAIPFSNPLDAKSVAGAVTISSAPAKVKTLASVPDGSNTIVIDPYALDPDTTYTAIVGANVTDTFKQTLGSAQQWTFRTSDFAPGAWAPSGTTVIPATSNVALNFYATNLPGNTYREGFARLTPSQMLGSPSALPLLSAWKDWPQLQLRGARRNEQSVVPVTLQRRLGGDYGALAYGFRTALDAPNADTSLTGIVQLTNLGVFAQWFPARGMVLAQHFSDGGPAQGAKVAVYRIDTQGSNPPQQCAAGMTNATGEADFAGTDIEKCYVLESNNEAPTLGVVVSEGSDVATVTTFGYSGVSRFNVPSGWTGGAPLSRGTVFTDRQMYQPGEHGQLTGVAYYLQGGNVVPDRNAWYTVTLTDPSNKEIALGKQRTDALGVFSLPMTFPSDRAPGYYAIAAKGSNGNELDGSLRVAEFKPPNFNLTLALDKTSASAGGSVHAAVSAAYLFGAPLQGGTAHAYVTRDVATVQPAGWDDFTFGPHWYWPEETPTFTTDVLQRDVSLDAGGKASVDVTVPSDLPFPMTYTVDMETTDVSNLSVSDAKAFLALPGDVAIGLASDNVGKAGSPLAVRTIVTDADGHPVSGRTVHLELQKMTYTSATQEEEGGENADQAVKYETVATTDVVSGNAPVTAQLTPPDAGPYRVVAHDGASVSDMQVFAFGAGEADWGLQDANAVAVKLDKKSYAVGDTVSALVASPYDRADIYLTVIRNDTIEHTVLHGVSGAQHFTFKVTPQMLPNAALEAVVVRRGTTAGIPKVQTLALTGLAAFDVSVADRYLKLAIAPHSAIVHPGGSQQLAFSLHTLKGAPVRGDVVAMVVNDAILQLSGYRLPDLVQTVFAQQPISTVFADNRENVTTHTQTPSAEKGFGYGGGFLAGAGKTRVRANFQPLAYYAVLHTDARGTVRANLTMPDDLTTWRVMAVGLDDDAAHFATADTTFISNQPLMANPLLPQFARPGDRFSLGMSIANQTGAAGALDLMLRLSGALAFEQDHATEHQSSENAQSGMQAYRFGVVAGTPAPTTVRGSASLGGNSDAFSVPFITMDRATTESVIESGRTTNGASVPLSLRGGTLQVTLANSIVPQFVVPSQYAMAAEPLPFAGEAAARLTIAAALGAMRSPYHIKLDFDPAAAEAQSIRALLSYRRDDGGFGSYAGDKASDPYLTAEIVNALSFAKARGVAIDAGVMHGATAFLSTTLANPQRFAWCTGAMCKAEMRFAALAALANAGDRRSDFLDQIVAQANNFDDATQLHLARYLLQTPAWRAQGAAMADHLEQTLYLTGRYATATTAQPEMLQLLLARNAPVEQLDGAVRALVAQQCHCGWSTLYDAAAALVALSSYTGAVKPAAGNASARVGSQTIGTAHFDDTASSKTFTVNASSLTGNALNVEGSGIFYTVLYTYPVPVDAPGQLAAFRVIRTLNDSRILGSGTPPSPLATFDLKPLGEEVSVDSAHVFDVGVRTIVDHPVDGLVIEDPLPAGFEAVDASFQTTLQAIVPQSDSWQIDTTQIYRDRVIAYAQHLDPGVYDFHYLVRSVTPGTFRWPGARAYLEDAPEQFGRSAGGMLTVRP